MKCSMRYGSVLLLAVAGVLATAAPAPADETETIQRAIDQAISQIGDQLAATEFEGIENVAVVPLWDDPQGYATEGLKRAVKMTSYGLFIRSDEEWDPLLSEIEWNIRREDIMSPETIQEFGRIEGVDAVLYGTIWDSSVNMWDIRGHVKMTVHLADVETGEILWSSNAIEAEAYLHWSDAITRFWRYPLLMMGGLVALIVLLGILRGISRAIKHSARPL